MTITISEMKELNNECCQINCNAQATHTMYWPGQKPKLVCARHEYNAKVVAEAMGIYLHTVENGSISSSK
jgi:hypothetical protein